MSEMGQPNKQPIPSASLQAYGSAGILPAMRAMNAGVVSPAVRCRQWLSHSY